MNQYIKIEQTTWVQTSNELLEAGWVFLGLSPCGNSQDGIDTEYTLGLPRQQPCGAFIFGHTKPKEYDHISGKWNCPHCEEEKEPEKDDYNTCDKCGTIVIASDAAICDECKSPSKEQS